MKQTELLIQTSSLGERMQITVYKRDKKITMLICMYMIDEDVLV